MPIINQVVKGGGSTPTGTKSITTNGVYDVTNFASADVQVPTTAPAHYIEKTVDTNGKLINGSSIIDFSGVTDIGYYVLHNAYFQNLAINGVVNLGDLTSVTGSSAAEDCFNSCTGITGVNIGSLTTVSGNAALRGMFSNCTNLTSANLSSLTTVSGNSGIQNMFASTKLTSINLGSLTTISSSYGCRETFSNCSLLTTVDLSSLTTITDSACCQQMFRNCTSLQSLSFPAVTTTSFGSSYTNQFTNMCQGISGITLHFPSNVQSVIEGLTGYSTTAPFGATSGTVLFDLPATE